MKAKIILLVSGAAIGGAALWLAWEARRSRAGTNAGLAATIEKRAGLDARLRDAEEQLAAGETRRAELRRVLDDLRAAKPATLAAGAAKASRQPTQRELLIRDPRLQALWLNAGRVRLAREYGPFYAAQRLSAAQIERLQAAIVSRQEQLMDLAGAADAQGPESRSAAATLEKRVRAEYNATARDILGPDGFQQLKDYERTQQVRVLVGRLAGAAAVAGAPLTPAQAEELTRAVANTTARYAGGGPAELSTIDWQEADARAQRLLAPAQFALFRSGMRMELQLDLAIARALEAERAGRSSSQAGSGS